MNPNRRSFLQASAAAASLRPPKDAPNILLVLTDDHSVPHLGCYGDKVVQTPNIDRFASEGMRFDRAYTTSPQCSPSRSSIMTGFPPQRTNMTRLHATLGREHKTYYEYLRAAGYYTGVAGRIHHMDGLGGPRWQSAFHRRERMVTMPERVDFHHTGPQEQGAAKFDQFLQQRPKDKPFVFQVGFTDPHQPWNASEQAKKYNLASIPVPPHYPDCPEIRQRLLNYYAEITHADLLFQDVIDVLNRRGLAENTIVLFIGDNGASHPFGKGTLYQAGWHVPLLVRWPGRIKPGTSTSELVSGVDLFATFLEAAGVPLPSETDGRSFLNLLLGKPHQGRDAVYGCRGWHGDLDLTRAVCTRTHSLLYNVWPEYHGPAMPKGYDFRVEAAAGRLNPLAAEKWLRTSRPLFEMFDLASDPYELSNLAGKPANQELEHRLKWMLTEHMELSHDYLPPPFLLSDTPGDEPIRYQRRRN